MKIERIKKGERIIWVAIETGSFTVLTGSIEPGYKKTDEVLTPEERATWELLSPLNPKMIIGIGLNYRFHAEETNAKIPEFPVVFFKALNALCDPGKPIRLPKKLLSYKVDYEAELAIIIGKECLNASKENALDYVFGYTCGNDVSARDWQKEWGGSQWSRGKSFDTFCPLGPCIVTAEEIPNPNGLKIKSTLNDLVVQDWTTKDMIFDVPTLIEFLSADTTLPAGTVILTGTPHGVGVARKPPLFMQSGDTITVEIEGIGELTNPIV